MMTTKLTTTLLGIAAGLTLVALPQTAQAQNSIVINPGGTVGLQMQLTTPQGTTVVERTDYIGNVATGHSSCPAACFGGTGLIAYRVSGTGFSPSGPVVFSNVPIILGITFVNVSPFPTNINGGVFNAAATDIPAGSPAGWGASLNPLTTPNFSVGQFHFTTPFPAPAASSPAAPAPAAPTFETLTASTQNFNIPDPISLQTGEGQAEAIFQAAQQQSLRPNGMHTRIIPAWTPGLYQ